MEGLVYIALGISAIAIFLAIIKIIHNVIKQVKEPTINEKAEIVRTNRETNIVKSGGEATVDTVRGYQKSTYYVTFKLKNKKLVTFKIRKKLFVKLFEHQTGMLTYKGYKLVDFEYEGYPVNTPQRKTMSPTQFFEGKKHTSPVVRFYGEAKELDVDYHSDQAIDCDQMELNKFIDQLIHNESENFFSLESSKGQILEVSNDGINDKFEIVYMQTGSKDRFIGIVDGCETLKSVIDAYFKEENIMENYKLTIE